MPASVPDDRLDSWKEIAAFLKRGIRTVQRWERNEGLPVHRHHHKKLGSVYAVRAEISAWWQSRGAAVQQSEPFQAGTPRRLKLMVLPFQNLSGDPAQEYLSDGLAEEMITQLARLQPEKLSVVARTTAMHYKGTTRRIGEIARELKLDYVLEGSVRRSGTRLRISAQLINACDETHAWAATYDRELADILALQAEAAQQIAREIRLVLAPAESTALSTIHATASDAYDDYLRGRYHLNRMTPPEVSRSIECFQQAVQKDSLFASAYAAMGNALSLLAIAPFDALPPRQAMPRALDAVERALQLDPTLAEAHAALGVIRHHYGWQWSAAEQAYRRALELDPNYAGARLRYAWLLLALGRFREALSEIQAAQDTAEEIDPRLVVVIRATRAAAFYFSRRYDKAIAECRSALRADKNYFLLHYLLARCCTRKGNHAAGIAAFGKEHVWGQIPLMDAGLALSLAAGGQRTQAAASLQRLHEEARARNLPATYVGMLYAALGNHDKAFEWLDKAFEERADGLTLLNVDPMADELRGDSRFTTLLRRIGLPELKSKRK